MVWSGPPHNLLTVPSAGVRNNRITHVESFSDNCVAHAHITGRLTRSKAFARSKDQASDHLNQFQVVGPARYVFTSPTLTNRICSCLGWTCLDGPAGGPLTNTNNIASMLFCPRHLEVTATSARRSLDHGCTLSPQRPYRSCVWSARRCLTYAGLRTKAARSATRCRRTRRTHLSLAAGAHF